MPATTLSEATAHDSSAPATAAPEDSSGEIGPPGVGPGETVVVSALDLANGSTRWSIGQSDALHGVLYPTGDGARVIVQSAWCFDNLVAALDSQTGELLWRTDPALPILEMAGFTPSVVDANGIIVVNAGRPDSHFLVALDTANGQTVWSTESSAEHGQMTAESGSVVAVWSVYAGTVETLDRRDGTVLWSVKVGEPFEPGSSGTPVIPVVITDDENVYVEAGDTLTAYVALTGDPVWSVTDPAFAMPYPIAAESGAVVTAREQSLIAYDAVTGAERWRSTMSTPGGAALSPHTLADGNVYVNTPAGLAAVDVATGANRWEWTPPDSATSANPSDPSFGNFVFVLAAGFGRVLVQAANGLQVLDAASGQPLWRPDPGRTQTAPYYSIGPDAVLTGAPCGGN